MRAASVNAGEVLSRLGYPDESGTFAESRAFSLGDATPAEPFLGTEPTPEDLLEIWKQLITQALEELVQRHVREYMDRYIETAEESPRFFYMPDIVTSATLERAKRIRDAKFAQKEKVVVYTAEEMKDIF